MIGLLLFIISIFLFVVLEIINFFVVLFSKEKINGYWLSAAKDVDKMGNRHFRALFNKTLIKKNGYKFGNIDETISEVLGHNLILDTLTIGGKIVVFILTKKHCLNAIGK